LKMSAREAMVVDYEEDPRSDESDAKLSRPRLRRGTCEKWEDGGEGV
jgi:hypothetical protein